MQLAHEGRRHGHYVIDRAIGRGGMATVFAATNERTGADVALKIVKAEHSEEARARFEHEATIAGKLHHKHVVRVYDFLSEPGGVAILVMERLRGEGLAALLARREKLTPIEALAVVLPVLAALGHTHRHGIVHRDVKASNVFVALEGDAVVPKLLDFGIATRPLTSPNLTADDEVLGTPSAMSPEQIRGDEVLDGRSDLFSVASLIIELLTGTAPFAAKTAPATLVAVLEREIDPAPEIPDRMFVELARALRKVPYERHASAEELASALRLSVDDCSDEALEKALRALAPNDVTEAPLHAFATGGTSRVRRPAARRRDTKTIVVLGAVAAVTIVVAFLFGTRNGQQDAARGALPTPSTPPSSGASSSPASPASPAAPGTAVAPSGVVTTTASAPSAGLAGSASMTAPAPAKSNKPRATKPVATRPDF